MSERARVLVADDEPGIRFVLRETLEEAGHDVVEATSGDEALAALGLGIIQMIRPKGTVLHRWLGRIWVAMMAFVALSSFEDMGDTQLDCSATPEQCAEDWLATPQFTPTAGANTLVFYASLFFDPDYGSEFEVHVSTASPL